MRASRVGVLTGVCAAILAIGHVLAPEAPAPLELVTPASTTTNDTQEATP